MLSKKMGKQKGISGAERKQLLENVKQHAAKREFEAASSLLTDLLLREGTPGKRVQQILIQIGEVRHDLGCLLLQIALSKGPPADSALYDHWVRYARKQGIADAQIHPQLDRWMDDVESRMKQQIDPAINRVRLRVLSELKKNLKPESETPAPVRHRPDYEDMSPKQNARLQKESFEQSEHDSLSRD